MFELWAVTSRWLMGLRLCRWREDTRFKGADTMIECPAELMSAVREWSTVDAFLAMERKGDKRFNFF